MAVVLSADESRYFSSSSLKRSHSGKFTNSSYTSLAPSPSKSDLHSQITYNTVSPPLASSPSPPHSPPPTAHADSATESFSTTESLPSTPASSISFDPLCADDHDDDQIVFPSYDEVGYYDQDQSEDLEPPASPRGNGESYTVSPTSNTASTDASRPDSPEPVEHAEDDTAIRSQPSRHVDYLSHNWREEDIWSSWQHIVSKRGNYSNSARLENASWRTWIKNKYKLKTVSPETLNWLKDCDVTWLYGPLQTGSGKPFMPSTSPIGSRMSKHNSFLHKKPILKKRSMSEIMLQRSLSASSLLKQAAAAVQAQQAGSFSSSSRDRPNMARAITDYGVFSLGSRRRSRENTSLLPSVMSSGLTSPGTEKKHIHFNEQVEQCIALEMKGDEDDDDAVPYPSDGLGDSDDSDSDDGAIMMKRSSSKRRLPPLAKKPAPPTPNTDIETIAMLPSTTLKYREDTPEPPESALKHSSSWSLSISPSPSDETLRPSSSSSTTTARSFPLSLPQSSALDDDDDWPPPPLPPRRDSVSIAHDRFAGLQISEEQGGMRRTPSGMFMPLEEDEDDIVGEGLFGRVVETVNTARDIAHVIWNVGWRR
ncbi:hypothetical protein V493_02985 [Pseudogymnoascus sp. VKM F-4281 (FW-2241)]|nr:hypothetical protein V493_02985 [Pseudogymnoascus sp. VKM F-4281 (FW-2241)]